MKNTVTVSVVKADTDRYPGMENPYFRPGKVYQEYPYAEVAENGNAVYAAVREALMRLGLDKDHIGKKEWNPFADIIKPGDKVLIKPNMVMDRNTKPVGGTEDCLYTNPAVIAPILDYVFKALAGTGSVTVGDAPMQECDFDNLVKEAGYDRLIEYYKAKGLAIQLVDFRKDITVKKRRISHRTSDPSIQGRVVDLAERSEFYGLEEAEVDKLRIVDYPYENLRAHHHGSIQEYYVSQYVLDADVVISMPKPKTHKKAGITAALKNMVGINAQKDYLPHHMFGSQQNGGDEYKDNNLIQTLRSRLRDKKFKYEEEKNYFMARMVWFVIAGCRVTLQLFGNKYRDGSWYGNHTISRTIADLNKILFYADKNGIIHDKVCRREFIVADMIVAGEKNGPVAPSPKKCGFIVAGEDNPVAFDEAIATLMGFDPQKIPTLVQMHSIHGGFEKFTRDEEVMLASNIEALDGKTLTDLTPNDIWYFEPADGWKGHIEKGG